MEYDPLDHWKWRNPLPHGNSIDSIAYGNGHFVAACCRGRTSKHGMSMADGSVWPGNGTVWPGTIMTSTDGTNWNFAEAEDVSRIRFSPYHQLFVGVGYANSIITSGDHVNWSSHDGGAHVLDVTCGSMLPGFQESGLLVAVGDSGAISTSRDAENWTPHSGIAGKDSLLWGIAYHNHIFVAVGDSGTIITAHDWAVAAHNWGDWTDRSLPNETRGFNAIAYGAGRFVAVGSEGLLATSTDGVTWTTSTTEIGRVSHRGLMSHLIDIIFAEGIFAAVGVKWTDSSTQGVIATSSDGLQWNEVATIDGNQLQSVAYGSMHITDSLQMTKGFMAAGFGAAVLTSVDGQTWKQNSPDTSYVLFDVAHGRDALVAVGGRIFSDSKQAILLRARSQNLGIWSPVEVGIDELLHACIYTGSETTDGMFLAVGGYGTILKSPDARSWRITKTRDDRALFAVAFGNETLVAVGDSVIWYKWDNGKVEDGKYDWMPSPNPFSSSSLKYSDIIFDARGMFVIVGDGGVILESEHGQSWRPVTTLYSFEDLRGIAFGTVPYKWVAVGQDGTILTSGDCSSWKASKPFGSRSLNGIAYINNQFVIVGANGLIATSRDAIAWTVRNSITDNDLRSATFMNGSFVAVGDYGTILQA